MNIQNLVEPAKEKINNIRADRKKSLATVVILSTLLVGSGAALASDGGHDKGEYHTATQSSINYTGPIDLVTISELSEKDSWFEDQSFTLERYIIKQVNDQKFLFTDGVDETTINFRADSVGSFSDNDKVRITGEYENEFFSSPHFDIKQISLL
ncbi:hypothetical protein BIT28_01760 [Photobacterium proteolyticum]|uniref:Bacterial OB-fold domain-containing protein n=1 Tax=Photobacterium proteolyticum TaxID=1903952 RepID=A0A1Q9GVB6_9GAMM|nr:NirD/YgiW/YdeI family stress tolerance protein [Photobacterium proteolyticum]OLQ79089.1 hypothetical protein BIT28_01760 [Photobacterium proteolyticum]